MYSVQTSRNQESNEQKCIPICDTENLVIIAKDFFSRMKHCDCGCLCTGSIALIKYANYPGFHSSSKMMNVWKSLILKLVKAIFPSPTVLSFSTPYLFSVSPVVSFISPFLPFLPTPLLPFPPAFLNSLLFVLPANVFSLSDSVGSSPPQGLWACRSSVSLASVVPCLTVWKWISMGC